MEKLFILNEITGSEKRIVSVNSDIEIVLNYLRSHQYLLVPDNGIMVRIQNRASSILLKLNLMIIDFKSRACSICVPFLAMGYAVA